jgi:hypothetical protein
MTKQEYFKFHEKAMEKMKAITHAKNADYTGSSASPFANFTRVEALGICSTEQGFLTRMTDKMARLVSFVQNDILQVKDESVEDTLLDLANYCILMAGYVRHKTETVEETVDDFPRTVDETMVRLQQKTAAV